MDRWAQLAIACFVNLARINACDLSDEEQELVTRAEDEVVSRSAFGDLSVVNALVRQVADRTDARLRLLRVKADGLRGRTPESTVYSALIEMRPAHLQTFCDQARLHANAGDLPQAPVEINQAIESVADDATLYALRATIHADNRDLAAAVDDCTQALALDPSLGYAYYVRGFVHTERCEHTLTVGDCDKAIQLDPGLKEAYRTRAVAYNHAGAFARAVEDGTAAVEIDPEYADAYRVRG